MYSIGVDLDGTVNDSFAFLSTFPDGTLRPQRNQPIVPIGSWNERSSTNPRGHSNYDKASSRNQSKPEEAQYDVPRRRIQRSNEEERVAYQKHHQQGYGSERIRHQEIDGRNSQKYPERGRPSQRNDGGHSFYDDRDWYRWQGVRQHQTTESLRSQPISDGRQHSNEYAYDYSMSTSRRHQRDSFETAQKGPSTASMNNYRVSDRWTEVRSEKPVAVNETVDGSYLWKRTKTYLNAIEELNNPHSKAERSMPMKPLAVPENYAEGKKLDTLNGNYSDTDDFRDSSSEIRTIPPPPPPPQTSFPPTFPQKAMVARSNSRLNINRKPTQHVDLPWGASDIQNARNNLRRTEPREPILNKNNANEPASSNFLQRLDIIVGRQAVEQRWISSKSTPSKMIREQDEEKTIVQTKKHEDIKTMGKNTTKKKLSEILKNGPPQRASFKGLFDMDQRREEALKKLRAGDKSAYEQSSKKEDVAEKLPSSELDNPTKRFPVPPDKGKDENVITQRQRALMGGVLDTIKMRGGIRGDSIA